MIFWSCPFANCKKNLHLKFCMSCLKTIHAEDGLFFEWQKSLQTPNTLRTRTNVVNFHF